MAYLPPHKRHSSTSTPTPTPTPSSLTSSLRSPSLSSPRGRHHPRPTDKIIHAAGCVFRWSAIPSFPPVSDDDDASLRLEPFPCDHIERKTGAKPLALVLSSREGYSDSAEAAAAAIADRFLPDLLAAAERVRASDVPKEEEEVKLGLVARVGKVLFQPGGSPVTLDSLREAAKAWEEGSRSQVRKSFYINVPSEFLDDMERSAVERMGLEFDSSKEHYHVKVFDKHQNDSTLSCKCTVQEDGKLAIHMVELKQVRQLVEDISCLFKDLDLRLMLRTKRILKNLDAEVENAIKSLVSSAVIDRNVKGGLRWTLGKESIGERFSIVGVWHTNYKAFRNQTLRLKLRHADRFDHQSSTGEVSNEVTLGLTGISERLEVISHPLMFPLEIPEMMWWEDANNLVLACLLGILSNMLFNVYVNFKNTKQFWDELDKKYSEGGNGNESFITATYLNFKMVEGRLVIEQLYKLQLHVHDLS